MHESLSDRAISESDRHARRRILSQDDRFRRAVMREHPELWTVRLAAPKPPRDVLVVALPKGRRELNADARSDRILYDVALKHSFTVPELMARRRTRTLVAAKHEAFWRLSQETNMSLPAIGRKMGGYDHTSVLHGIARHEQRMREGQQG